MTAVFNWGLLSTARINNAILGAMPQSERGDKVREFVNAGRA